MDDDVEPPVFFSHASDELVDLKRLGQIAGKLDRVIVASRRRAAGEIDAQDLRSGRDEKVHNRGADASPSAGNQGNFPGERDE
jgi:hypothetical protein